jgi:hypothetical protein
MLPQLLLLSANFPIVSGSSYEDMGDSPPSDFELYANGDGGRICATGKALTQEECLDAAHEVGVGMNLRDSLNVGSWNFTPCGCFIYIDDFVDYKDPANGNCKPDSDSNLVCRK